MTGTIKPSLQPPGTGRATGTDGGYTNDAPILGLALTHHKAGRLGQAEILYLRLLKADPEQPMVLHLLGGIAHQRGDDDNAVKWINQALVLAPDFADAHYNLGLIYYGQGNHCDAIDRYQQAIAVKPDFAEAHSNLGVVLKDQGRFNEAEESIRQALILKPDFAMALTNLANLYNELARQEETIALCRQALALEPDLAEAHNNLGVALKELGQLDEALVACRQAIAVKPDFALAHSNLLLCEQYRPDHTALSLLQQHDKWDRQHGHPLYETWPVHPNNRDPERRIRMGFVSPDLRHHPVGYFIVGLLEHLNGDQFESVCYSTGLSDDLSKRIKSASHQWHPVGSLTDTSLARRIGEDRIDILFDLSGHSRNNRLLVFARKPAPVQVTWAGYVGTTGLAAMDYLLSDGYSTPPGEDPFYREKILRMEDGWLSYTPPAYAPPVAPQPSENAGFVTFASFNNPVKLNAGLIGCWAAILQAVADARLILKYRNMNAATNAERIYRLFRSHGIDADRLTLEGWSSHRHLLDRYGRVDIALDPFPYSGGLTTLEALWMGVPVVTTSGQTFASRHSQSHLSNLGHPDLVASDPDDYIKKAVALARDAPRRAARRADLRSTMAASPLCDNVRFANGFAGQMRHIWQQWCLG